MTEAFIAAVIPAFAGMTGLLVLHAVFIYVRLNRPK